MAPQEGSGQLPKGTELFNLYESHSNHLMADADGYLKASLAKKSEEHEGKYILTEFYQDNLEEYLSRSFIRD